MSMNMRYKKEFDEHAGSPADFDTLFCFENNELITKKRIRQRLGIKKAAWTAAAAAALISTAMFCLTQLNLAGITSEKGVEELADIRDLADTSFSEEYLPGEALMLSEALGKFAYFDISPTAMTAAETESGDPALLIENTIKAYGNSDIILTGYVSDRQMLASGDIIYTILPSETYHGVDIHDDPLAFDDSISVFSANGGENAAALRLQPGCEYILALNDKAETDSSLSEDFSLAEPYAFYIRKTEYGWLMLSALAEFSENTLPVANDMAIFGDIDGLCIESSDEQMQSKLHSFLNNQPDKIYYSEIEDGVQTRVIPIEELLDMDMPFESIEHLKREDNSTDRTVLVLENREYFELAPGIDGEVIYTGTNALGDNIAAIRLNGEDGIIALFVGMSEITVGTGDTVSGGIIGRCSTEPVYCRFIGSFGAIETDLSAVTGSDEANAYTTVTGIY